MVWLLHLPYFVVHEFQQLRDQLHEKVKENRRIKENFDTLKMANDSLNKEVCKINAGPLTLRLWFAASEMWFNAVVMCLSVCLSVRPSQAGIVPKRLNVGSCKQRHTIAQELYFSDAKILGEIPTASPPTGAPNRGGYAQIGDFWPNILLYLRNGARWGDIATMEH